jgi:hypothetical protein
MKIKTSELSGVQLDWAVAKCEGLMEGQIAIDGVTRGFYKPSTKWSQGGPIIERERINLRLHKDTDKEVSAFNWVNHAPVNRMRGSTPLIAAMRCYVASKLGDEVEIPEELK